MRTGVTPLLVCALSLACLVFLHPAAAAGAAPSPRVSLSWASRPPYETVVDVPFTPAPSVVLKDNTARPVVKSVSSRYRCSLSLIGNTGVLTLTGLTSVSPVQSTCVFQGVAISAVSAGVLLPAKVPLSACVTNATGFVLACNTTTVALAACGQRATPYNVTNALQSSASSMVAPFTFVVEGYFPSHDRRFVQCVFTPAAEGGVAETVPAFRLSVCRVQCAFPLSRLTATDAAFGYLNVLLNGRLGTGTCPGSATFVSNSVEQAQRQSICSTSSRNGVRLGCPVMIVGAASRVAFSTYSVVSYPTPAHPVSSQTLAQPLDFAVCDAASNAVTSTLLPTGASRSLVTSEYANYTLQTSAVSGLALTVTNATIPYTNPSLFRYSGDVNASDTCIGNLTGGAPLLLQPASLMGWRVNATTHEITVAAPLPCVSTTPGEAVAVRFQSPTTLRRTADTLAPLLVTVSGFDKYGHELGSAEAAAINVTVAVEIATRDVSGNLVRASANPIIFTQTVAVFPAVVPVSFPVSGANYTLLTYLLSALGDVSSAIDVLPGIITVRYCSPDLAFFSGVSSVTATFTALQTCGRRSNVTLSSLLVSSKQPLLNIVGALFDYDKPAYCHFSTVSSPWSAEVIGTPATVISSCEMSCQIEAQSLPIRHAVGMAGVPSSSSPVGVVAVSIASLPNAVGQLRIRQESLPWSNAVEMDVIGKASTLAITSWSQDLYSRRALTFLAPITVAVVDILGNSRAGVDDVARTLQLYSPPLAQQQLNATGVTRVFTRTCSPVAGQATFSDLLLLDPEQGDYGLYFSGDGLDVTSSTILHIRSMSVDYQHYLGLDSAFPVPKAYVNVSVDPSANGLLPIQPVVGIYKMGSSSTTPDDDVSDVNCIATVSPLDPSESVDAARGLGLRTRNSAFGNFASFSLGVATFTKLRFLGTAGKSYRITFFHENTTASVATFDLIVYTPVCPIIIFAPTAPVAQVVSLPNASLIITEDVIVKGWTFPIPTSVSSYTCLVGNAVLPARFIDMCTVQCFKPDPRQVALAPNVTICPSASNNCCYDTALNLTRCTEPDSLKIELTMPSSNTGAAGSVAVEVGTFTFLGPPAAVQVVPNVQSPWSLFGNQQAVLSANVTRLHTVIVSLFDALGHAVGRTDSAVTRPVAIGAITRRPYPVLSIPSNRSAVLQRLGSDDVASGDYSCFPTLSQNTTLQGVLVLPSVNGTVQFGDVTLMNPAAGAYDIAVQVYAPVPSWPPPADWNASANLQFTTTLTVHVLPGLPTHACLVSDMTGTKLSNVEPLVPQPVVMLLDDAGNLVQPFVRDTVLVSSGVSDLINLEAQIQRLSITALLYGRPYDYTTQNASGPYALVSSSLTAENAISAPSPDYLEASDVSLVQFAFKQLTPVRTVFGAQYLIRFHVAPLSPVLDVVTPPMLHRQCDASEYGTVGTDVCTACPSGLSHCVGGSTAKCFNCNGSTGLNVTAGYWRDVPGSVVAYACSTGGVCLGDTELGTCGPGYLNHRPLCAVCEDGNAHDFLGACVSCAPTWVSVLVLCVFVFAAAVVLGILIMATVKEDGNQEDAGDQSLVGLLKIFVNFVQVTGMIGEFQVNFPSYVLTYFNIVAASSGGSGISISPINCLFPSLTYLDKLVVQLVLPPVLLIGLACVLLIRGYRKRQSLPMGSPERAKAKLFNRNLFVTSAVVLLFIIYQTIVTQCIDTFACVELDTGVPGQQSIKVLRQDARVDCRDIEYERHVAVAMYGLFLYGAVLPLTGMILVLRTARTQGWFAANGTFSFLIRGFRLRLWFWEFVIVFRKVLVRVLLSAVKDATLQALLGIWTLTGLFILHAFARPYVKAMHNRAEGLGLLTLVVTLNIGLLFRGAQLTSGDVCGPTCAVVVIVLIAFNLGVIGYFIYSIGRALLEHVIELFGVDNVDGTREVSRRNVKRVLLGMIKQEKRQSPSFIKYTPNFQNRELAVSLLGETTVSEVEKVLHKNEEKALDDIEFALVGGEDDDAPRFELKARGKRSSRTDGSDRSSDRNSDGESDSDGAHDGDGRESEDEAMAIAETDALLDAIFDPIEVPEAPDQVPLPREAKSTVITPPRRRRLQGVEDLPIVAVETVVDVAESAVDAAKSAKLAATEAARLAKEQARLAASFAVDMASDAAHSAVLAAREMASEASSAANNAADLVKDTTHELVRSVHQGVASASRRVRDQAGRLLNSPSSRENSDAVIGENDPTSPPLPVLEASAEEQAEMDADEAAEMAEDLEEARRLRRRRRSRRASARAQQAQRHREDDDGDEAADGVADLLHKLNAAGLPTS